jgi:hypothetical protein
MFSIAMETGRLSRRPIFKMLDGERVRQGFVEHGDFAGCLSIYQHIFSRWSNFFIAGMAKEGSTQPEVERDRSAGPHGASEGRGLKKRRTLGSSASGAAVGNHRKPSKGSAARLSVRFSF